MDGDLYKTAHTLYNICKRHFCSVPTDGVPCYGEKIHGVKSEDGGDELPCGVCSIGKAMELAAEMMSKAEERE